MDYQSTVEVESAIRPGVRYAIRRMSFGRRLELTRKIRETLGRLQFLEAGEQASEQAAEAALLGGEIDGEYLRWGLARIDGLTIDGQPATPEGLIELGPEELLHEALAAVQREAGLSEEERKNSESHSTLHAPEKAVGDATSVAA